MVPETPTTRQPNIALTARTLTLLVTIHRLTPERTNVSINRLYQATEYRWPSALARLLGRLWSHGLIEQNNSVRITPNGRRLAIALEQMLDDIPATRPAKIARSIHIPEPAEADE